MVVTPAGRSGVSLAARGDGDHYSRGWHALFTGSGDFRHVRGRCATVARSAGSAR